MWSTYSWRAEPQSYAGVNVNYAMHADNKAYYNDFSTEYGSEFRPNLFLPHTGSVPFASEQRGDIIAHATHWNTPRAVIGHSLERDPKRLLKRASNTTSESEGVVLVESSRSGTSSARRRCHSASRISGHEDLERQRRIPHGRAADLRGRSCSIPSYRRAKSYPMEYLSRTTWIPQADRMPTGVDFLSTLARTRLERDSLR